jgi:hypothetical protein
MLHLFIKSIIVIYCTCRPAQSLLALLRKKAGWRKPDHVIVCKQSQRTNKRPALNLVLVEIANVCEHRCVRNGLHVREWSGQMVVLSCAVRKFSQNRRRSAHHCGEQMAKIHAAKSHEMHTSGPGRQISKSTKQHSTKPSHLISH